MDREKKFKYWEGYAQEDLKTAEAMIQTERWIYVAFMCQQAIEKLVKGLYGMHLDFDNIPRTHNISRLINDFVDKLPEKINTDTLDFFDLLTRYYLNNRYPDYVNELSQQTKEGNSKEIYNKTKEVFAWLLILKP